MAFPFLALIISAGFTVAGQLLAPRPKTKAAGADEIQVPTATESRPIPYFFGTVEHKSPNTLWYGDYSTKAIKTGGILTLFIKTVVGYKYYLGFDLGFSVVEFDALKQISVNDKIAWQGSIKDGTITINKPELFGKADKEGGFQATAEIYSGTASQTTSNYLKTKAHPDYPPARRRGHIVFHGLSSGGAYIGNQPQIGNIKCVFERFPNQLGVTGDRHIIDGGDANPVCVLYDILTNKEIGAGYDSSDFNLPQWKSAAAACHAEGLGVSGLLDTVTDVDKLTEELLNTISAVINQNKETAEFELKLARGDYDINTIPTLSMDDVISIEYARNSWLDNVNHLKLPYIDREDKFRQKDAAIPNVAMQFIQDEARASETSVKFISTGKTAQMVLFRELLILTLPLARIKLATNRKAYNFQVGTVFKLSGTPYGISNIALRVTKFDDSKLSDGKISIEATEDIFGLTYTVQSSPESLWTAPVTEKTQIISGRLIESPRFFHQTDVTRVIAFADQPNGAQLAFNLYAKESTETNYLKRIDSATFAVSGALMSELSDSATTIIASVLGADELPNNISESEIRQGAGLILINNEILAYENFTVDEDGQYEFTNLWRGLLDTVPATHPVNSKIYFLSDSAAFSESDFTSNAIVNAKMTSIAGNGETELDTAFTQNISTAHRAIRPYPVADISIEDTSAITT